MIKNFETVIEKLGRILARKYSVNVQFEGNLAYTDGTNIVLPSFPEIDNELYRDLNGYLDHEVAHVKFTDFDELKHLKLRFHKEMLNAIEDSRIEIEMEKVFPGVALNLGPLNAKLRAKMAEKWLEIPWPIRLIVGVRDIMEGKEPRVDEDIKKYVDLIRDAARELVNCDSTRSVRIETEKIVKKIIDEHEKEKEESGDGKEGEAEGESKKTKGKKGKGKPGEGAKGKSDSERSEDSDSSPDVDDEMLSDEVGEKSEFDEHVHDVHDLIKEAIDKKVGGDEVSKTRRSSYRAEFSGGTKASVPVTTRFDKVTDHTGKGKIADYARLKRQVQPLVSPIKQQLERVLKVKENAKWRTERERGSINSRSLFQVGSNPNYRTVFKEFTKVETKNVAVQILVDMSGSMAGKIDLAKMATIAMSEALQSLDISFEVTGFYSIRDARVEAFTRTLGSPARFNRTRERLDLHVFKSFDARSLTGLEKLHHGAENPDGECLAWAAKRLCLRKEKRKIMLVMSDGQPSTSDADRSILCTDLKNKIEALKKSGVEVIGVGIETDYVKNYYPDFVVIDNVRDLPKKTMNKLSKLISK